MLRISVILFDGTAPTAPMYCEFDERGGTIGRDSSNKMALPDPDRVLSRMQAQVQFAAGEFRLLDHGGNPTSLNGRPIGKGNVTALHDGDELQMGNYVLRAEFLRAPPKASAAPAFAPTPAQQGASAPASMSDPLGLLGDSGDSQGAGEFELLLQPPPSQPAFTVPPTSTPAAPRAVQPPSPPMPPVSAPLPPAASDDPFAVFAASPAVAPALSPSAPPVQPNDDPFAAFAPKPAPVARPAVADPFAPNAITNPLGIDLGQGSGSVDDMFGLGQGPATSDPFAGSALADPQRAPAIAEEVDPLALLSGSATPATPAAAFTSPASRNDGDIMRDAFIPPAPVAAPAAAVEPPAPPPKPVATPARAPQPTPAAELDPMELLGGFDAPAPAVSEPPPAAPVGGVVSWGQPIADAAVLISDAPTPLVSPVVPQPAPSRPAPRAKVSVEGLGETAPSAEPTNPAPAAPGLSADNAELLAAFVRGLGMQSLKIPGGVTPQFMEQVGVMLREAVQGTVELLVARAAIKREVRAEVTMIVSRNNNPLKFSPDVDFAITQLLAPHGSGFMPPTEAMRDAYDDLRAHQLGFMAGMRAAIAGLLGKFRPEDLETRLADKSLLDSLLPSSRKGKLWDLFSQRYSEISKEAEEDFHALFGREFLKAYEAQIDRLQNKN